MKTYSLLKNIKTTFLAYVLFFISTHSVSNTIDSLNLNTHGAPNLSFKLDNNNFFINNEYFSPVVEGYTLFGYWINPKLNLKITKEISIEAGFFANKYFGIESYSHFTPTYTIDISKQHTKFQIGTIDFKNTILSSPLISDERKYTNPTHEGMYFLHTKAKLKTSIWVEWEDFLFHNEDKQEVLNICTSNKLRHLFDSSNQIGIGLEAIILHKGGQINANPKKDLVMTANTNTSLFYIKKLYKTTLTLSQSYYGYTDMASVAYDIYKNGEGHLSSIDIERKSSHIKLSNWSASQYLSNSGNPIYNCRTTNWSEYPKYSDKKRDLVICSYTYTKHHSKSAQFKTGFTGYFDYRNNNFDYNYWISVIINFDQNIAFPLNKGHL